MNLIGCLREHYKVTELCRVFGILRSSYNYRVSHANKVCPERERLKRKVAKIHTNSRSAAGARTIAGTLSQQGESIGRYKASRLMKEIGLVSKQYKKHRYKQADRTSHIADNLLNREFAVGQPNQVWCGVVMSLMFGRELSGYI